QEPLPVAVISFLDENFFARKKEDLVMFFKLYKERVNIPYIIYSSPNYITDENLEKAIDSGLRGIQIGLQSGSESVCKNIYKRTVSIKKFLESVERVKRYDVVPNIDVICDNPFETLEDDLATIEVLCKIPKPYFFYLLSLTFFEGIPLRKIAEEKNPEVLHDPHVKDILITKPTTVNRLKHLAGISPSKIVMFFSKWYKKNPDSVILKILVEICFWFTLIFIQPFVFLWILYIFSKKSIKQMLKYLYYFVDFRIFKTFNFWRTSKDTAQT
ncbi:MAG: radical SAM protein, partial [Candidatus Hydrogenedens sp.]